MPDKESSTYLCTLVPKTSKAGNDYFAGIWGSVKVMGFYAKDGKRLNLYFMGNEEREEGGGGYQRRGNSEKPAPKQEDVPF